MVVRTRPCAGKPEALGLVGLRGCGRLTPVSHLGVGHQQLVEIASALSRHCRLLILDEPTAPLTDPQTDLLFEHLRHCANPAWALYVSHRMDELRRIADRATILRDGRVVCSEEMSQLSSEQIVRLLTGKESTRVSSSRAAHGAGARCVLKAYAEESWATFVRGRAGEIFGIAGLVGSGRTELLQTIFGAGPPTQAPLKSVVPEPRRFARPGKPSPRA